MCFSVNDTGGMPLHPSGGPGQRLACIVALIGLAVVCLAGCITDPALEARSAALREPQSSEAARVLYRIDLRIDGKRASPWARIQPVPFGNNVRLYIANLDKHELVRPMLPQKPLPGALGEDGWASLALEPGTYFFLVLPPGGEQGPPVLTFHAPTARFGRLTDYKWSLGRGGTPGGTEWTNILYGAAPSDFVPIPGFLLRVPEKQPLVYAGTLRISCTSRGLLGDLFRDCSDTSVSDETAAARSAAEALGAHEADLHPSLLSRYGSPTAPLDVGGAGIHALAVTPIQDDAGIDFSPLATAPPVQVGAAPGGAPGVAVLIFNLFSVLDYAAGAAVAEQEARVRAVKWDPCMRRLAHAARSLDLDALVSSASASALEPLQRAAPSRSAAQDGPASGEPRINFALATRVDPRQVRLRECVTRGTFCLELAMRVKFTDLAMRRDVFDAELVYASAWPLTDMWQTSYRWYQLPVDTRSECRTLETWCGDGGVELLEKEAATGIDAIMRTAVQRAARR